MKTCNRCSQEKPAQKFAKDSRNKDGLQGICEDCRKLAKQKSRDLRQAGINIVFVKEKQCNACKRIKAIDMFFADSGVSDGHAAICKECKTKSSMQWRANNKERYNATQRMYHAKNYQVDRLKRYNITPEQHKAMFEEQGGVCKLCKKPQEGKRPLVVDHNHATGEVRGLLCYGCNRKIVILDSSEAEITAALEYVKGKNHT